MKTKEYREKLAESFLNLLEEKSLEWKKGWKDVKQNTPINVKSKKYYKGLNRFTLFLTALNRGYCDPRWATFNQIKESGWTLKDAKGKGVKVEYWYIYDRQLKKTIDWKDWEDLRKNGQTLDERYCLLAKYATVFNAEHIVGIPELEKNIEENKETIEADILIKKLSESMGVQIIHDGGDSAYYSVLTDKIHLPKSEKFIGNYEYNSTVLHELSHATGAIHRLNRDIKNIFGSEAYAYEELIAEISSCFMSSKLQIEQTESHVKNHKAYVQSWIHAIKEKPEVLIKAIQQAEKTTAYMEFHAGIRDLKEYKTICSTSIEVEENQIYEPKKQKLTKSR